MAYSRKTYKGVYEDTNEVYVCDEEADISSLPTDAAPGSSAFVIETSATYMITSSGVWVETTLGSGGGGSDIRFKNLTVTSNGSYTAPAGTAYKKVVAEVQAEGTASVVYDYITDTNIAYVPDAKGNEPVASLSVSIEPVQDLHGYDAPWPAGWGVNLLNPAGVPNENKYVKYHDGKTGEPGTPDVIWNHTDYIAVTPGDSLYFGQINAPAGTAGTAFYDADKEYITGYTASNLASRGNILTVPEGAAFMRHSFRVDGEYNSDWENTVYITISSNPHEFTPYSNICPVSGWTGAHITVSPTQDAQDGTTYSVSWRSDAGEVYGGTLDAATGTLTVDRMSRTFAGTESWVTMSSESSTYYALPIGDLGGVVDDSGICSHFPPADIRLTNTVVGQRVYSSESAGKARFIVRPGLPGITDVEGFKSWLAEEAQNGTPVQACWAVTSPRVYSLRPVQAAMLSGDTYIWADCGDIISMKYRADTNSPVDRVLPADISPATEDGKTHIWVRIDGNTPAWRETFQLAWSQSVSRGVAVNWGDGSAEETFEGTGSGIHTHTYAPGGVYEITLEVTDGTISFTGTNGTSGTALYGSKANASCYNRSRILCVVFGRGAGADAYMLQYCYGLKYISLPYGTSSIGSGAFSNCVSLTDAYLPNSVVSVGPYAFYYCYSMESVRLPQSVESIGDYAFNNCFALKEINIPYGVPLLGEYAFRGCYNLSSLKIPDSVAVIGIGAVDSCYGLTELTIPASVHTIGASAFSNCFGIREYHMKRTTPPTLSGTDAFSGIASDCVIYVPYSADHSVLNAYKSATNWATYAAKIQEEAQS